MTRRFLTALVLTAALATSACTQAPPPPEPTPVSQASPSPEASPDASPEASPSVVAMPSASPEVVAATLKDGVYASENVALAVLSDRVLDLVRRERFQDLDRLAVDMRLSRSSFGSPWLHVTRFYESFRDLPVAAADAASWKAWMDAVTQWRKQSPESAAAVLALANLHLARASRMIQSKDPRLQREAAADLEEAAKLCDEANRLAPDEPEVWVTRMRIGYIEKAPAKKMDEWLAGALATDVAYAPAWQERAAALAGGKPGEWEKLAGEAGDKAGDSVYALIVWRNALGDDKAFEKGNLSWARTRKGFLELDARYPRNLWLVSAFAKLACIAEDAPAARALFDRVGTECLPAVWGDCLRFEGYRAWAFKDGASAKSDPELTGYRADAAITEMSTEGRSATVRADAFRLNVRDLWERERFPELEAVAATLREEAMSGLALEPRLEEFYDAIVGPGFADEAAWKAFDARVKRWLAAVGQSVTAPILLADAQVAHAWDIRGSAAAENVPRDAWQKFQEGLSSAHASYTAADEKAKAAGIKDPHLYLGWMAAVTGMSGSRELLDSLYAKALADQPAYIPAIRRKAWTLLPRSLGKPGEIDAFAVEAAGKTSEPLGKGVYAVVAMLLYDEEGDAVFKRTSLKWEDVRQGFEDLRRIVPDATLVDRFARMACAAGDRATARSLMQVIGNDPAPLVWGGMREWERWKKWAGG